MKVKIPRQYNDLPTHEQEIILQMMADTVNERVEKEGVATIEVMLKLMCVWLHDVFHFTKDDLTLFLGNWNNIFKWNDQMLRDDTQEQELNRRTQEIFEGQFPQKFIDRLLQKEGKK